MEEILLQRKAELEIAAKNVIVEIHLLKMNVDAIAKTLEAKEKLLAGIDAALRELEHIGMTIKTEDGAPE